MSRTTALIFTVLFTEYVSADPIPKKKPVPTYGIVLRDGMKSVFTMSQKNAAGQNPDDVEIVYETKKAESDERGTYFDRTRRQRTGNFDSVDNERYYVEKSGHVFLVRGEEKHALTDLSGKKIGDIFQRKSLADGVLREQDFHFLDSEVVAIPNGKVTTLKFCRKYNSGEYDVESTSWYSDQDGPGAVRFQAVFSSNGAKVYETLWTLKEYTEGK